MAVDDCAKHMLETAMKKVAIVGTSKIDLFLLGMEDWPSVSSERAPVNRIEYHTGGNGLNVARHLAGMGGFQVQLFTAYGHHAQGRTVQAALQYKYPIPHETPQEPFAVPIVAKCPLHDGKLHTGLSCIHIDKRKEPQFATYAGVSKLINLDFLLQHITEIQSCDLLFFGGAGTSTGLSFGDVATFLGQVRHAEKPPCVVVDVNLVYAPALRGQLGIVHLAPILQHVDYFVPNETEAVVYSGCDNSRRAANTFNINVRKATIIKCGARGVTLYEKNKKVVHVQQSGLTNMFVDTTGAGDAWCAGFIAHILRKPDAIIDSCHFANKVAAFSTLKIGATSNLHSFEWYQNSRNKP